MESRGACSPAKSDGLTPFLCAPKPKGRSTWPGPVCWIGLYGVLDIAAIWPYNASNAAVPLAAVLLGHLPQTGSDQELVKLLGFTIFLLAFVPLIFGGTVYGMLEKIMTAKLVLVPRARITRAAALLTS